MGRQGAGVTMGEGFTPLEEMDFEGRRAFIKLDYLFPTGSFKDRGAAVLVGKAKELGIRKVVEDSSGNAGCAIAAYCTRADIECAIYVPEETSPGKLVQIQTYGARLKKVRGSRERTAAVTMRAALKTYYASHCWNPFFLHGTKTFAFEVWEQMGWTVPDAVVLPAGHGTLVLGSYIGFNELKEAGLIKNVPRLIVVQSASCDPLFQAFRRGLETEAAIQKKQTVAEGIAIASPIRGKQILKAIRETDGDTVSVSDKQVIRALREMGERGHYIEPTAAATIAGLKTYLKHLRFNHVVVSTLTGVGLKATEKIRHLISKSFQ